jgi:predicted RNA binding protein YcfA (HicA-like mRNA interferase family)
LKKRVIQILLDNGFEQVRSESHITFKKADKDGKILTTWVPHHREVTVFVIQHIIRQTGISREEFE